MLHSLRHESFIRVAMLALMIALAMLTVAAAQDGEGDATDDAAPAAEQSLLEQIWHFKIKSSDPVVELSQLIIAIGVVIIGMILSSWLTRTLRKRLLTRVRLDINAAAAIQKVLFYLLAVLIVLMAMQMVQIPISMFAFLGAALALGIGFGAQNILNNFISGLILMVERPIRLGDIVEIDGHRGRVEDIRLRCTRIRRADGIDMLVPNSSFLEQSVVNWTLSDRQFRVSVTVGVAYGSPTELVAGLMKQAAEEHKGCLDNYPVNVVFDDFGDNALIFVAYFWTEVESAMELRVMCSDIRFRIDHMFRDAGIEIAFPQRDVHLDTLKPLEVRVIRRDEERAADSSSAQS